MSTFYNDYDIAVAIRTFDVRDTPRLHRAAVTLANLADWADDNSDGWAYWPKPLRAAQNIIQALESAKREYHAGRTVVDLSEHELQGTYRAVKALLTRHGADHDGILV